MTVKTIIKLLAVVSLATTGINISHAKPFTLPTFQCQLTDKLDPDRWPGVQKDSFGRNDPMIYFICTSDNALTGDTIRAVWLADHVDKHPQSYETVGVRSMRVVKRRNGGETVEANLSLAKPFPAWAVGHYHIQVYINDIEGYTYKFVIR